MLACLSLLGQPLVVSTSLVIAMFEGSCVENCGSRIFARHCGSSSVCHGTDVRTLTTSQIDFSSWHVNCEKAFFGSTPLKGLYSISQCDSMSKGGDFSVPTASPAKGEGVCQGDLGITILRRSITITIPFSFQRALEKFCRY